MIIIIFLQSITDRQGLKHVEDIRRLNQAVVGALQRELTNNPPNIQIKGDVSVLSRLLNKRGALR